MFLSEHVRDGAYDRDALEFSALRGIRTGIMVGSGTGDGGVFERTRDDGSTRLLRVEISSLTTHLMSSVNQMYQAMREEVASGKLDKKVQEQVQAILRGQGGTLGIVLDVEKLPQRMTPETRDATLKLIEDAVQKLLFNEEEVQTKLHLRTRQRVCTHKTHDPSTDQELRAL